MSTGTAANARKTGLFKSLFGGILGLAAGVIGVYGTALVDKVAKPSKPVANFAVSTDGLTVTCQNHASGQSGWWDFGDGSPLEPFQPEQPAVTHTYAKPGNYAVKLIVRNFLMEENERSVPVDLNVGPGPQSGPSIPSFTVEPIGFTGTAPATFRVRGEVKNADRVIWDLGSERLEVTDSPGVFEKLVVFEKPGPYQVQLIGYSGKQAVKRAAQVNVSEARVGSLSVLLRVTDTCTSVERQEFQEMIAVPLPPKGVAQLERVVPARPGFQIVEGKLGRVSSSTLRNLRLEPATDRKSIKLLGDWTGSGEAAVKSAGGSDVIIPLQLVEEKSGVPSVTVETVAVPLTLASGFLLQDASSSGLSALIPLPPVPANVRHFQRKIQFEIRETSNERQSRSIGALPELKLPFKGTVVTLGGRPHVVDITQSGNQLRVTLTPIVSRPS